MFAFNPFNQSFFSCTLRRKNSGSRNVIQQQQAAQQPQYNEEMEGSPQYIIYTE